MGAETSSAHTSMTAYDLESQNPIVKSEKEPTPPPDGGLRAWLVVLATHLTVMNTWGIISVSAICTCLRKIKLISRGGRKSFGVFQTYYATILPENRSAISWIGSVQVFLLFFVGVFGGRATDAGYFRHVYSLGVLLQVFGIMMTSFCRHYWQFFLAQGVCCGLANGLMFCAGLSVMSTYFKQWKSIAVGFATCGSVIGGIVYPLMGKHLILQLGFPWAMRCIGFVCLATLLLASALYKTRVPPRITGPIIERAAFRELSYNLFLLGMLSSFHLSKIRPMINRRIKVVFWSSVDFISLSTTQRNSHAPSASVLRILTTQSSS